VTGVDEKRLESLFSTLGVEERKGFLASIVAALTRGLREEERQEIVRAALAGNGSDQRLSGMVEH
jgi:hypothetical protein